MDVIISVPTSFISPWTLERETLIDFNSVAIKGVYNNQPLAVEWTMNNVILIMDAVETTTTPQPLLAQDNFNGMQFDASKIGLEYDLNSNDNGDSARRRRRSVPFESTTRGFSPYTQRVLNSEEFGSSTAALDDFTPNRLPRSAAVNKDAAINNLPINRTMFFNCENPYDEFCFQARISVLNFKASSTPIMISLKFSIDLAKIGETFLSISMDSGV